MIIRNDQATILVDFGPDIKQQLLTHNITKIDAVICTHDHADHTAGIDELRVFAYNSGKPLPIYSNRKTLDGLKKRSEYLFKLHDRVGPFLKEEVISDYEKFKIGDIELQIFDQAHGHNSSLGIRVRDFVYSNDITEFPEESKKFLHNIDTWVLDCVDYKRTSAHAGLDEVLLFDKEYLPGKILLTNLGHNLDYEELSVKLPNHIRPAFDGISIKF